ncbi:MAG: hypothetical protein ABIB93_00375, partial [Chloroflexota bacterium]
CFPLLFFWYDIAKACPSILYLDSFSYWKDTPLSIPASSISTTFYISSVIKYGTYKSKQRYWCKVCNRKFVSGGTIPKMQTPTKTIASVLNMYYEGMSEAEIRRNLIQQDTDYVSTGSIYSMGKQIHGFSHR